MPLDKGKYWILGKLDGIPILPIYGRHVPLNTSGCLESDLLSSYGFPVQGQNRYKSFIDIIKEATMSWNIPVLGGGGNWYDENHKSKMDKFIYAALTKGFKVSGRRPQLPKEPSIITRLKAVMS
jgi:hypothetical protein